MMPRKSDLAQETDRHRSKGQQLLEGEKHQLMQMGKQLMEQIEKLLDPETYGELLKTLSQALHRLELEDLLYEDLRITIPKRDFQRYLQRKFLLDDILATTGSIEELTMKTSMKLGRQDNSQARKEYEKILWFNQDFRRRVEDFEKEVSSLKSQTERPDQKADNAS